MVLWCFIMANTPLEADSQLCLRECHSRLRCKSQSKHKYPDLGFLTPELSSIQSHSYFIVPFFCRFLILVFDLLFAKSQFANIFLFGSKPCFLLHDRRKYERSLACSCEM